MPKNKVAEVEEVQNLLVATQSLFAHETLNYVNSIALLQSKKRHMVLSTVRFIYIAIPCLFFVIF